MLKLEEGLGLPIPITKLAYVNFPVKLKFRHGIEPTMGCSVCPASLRVETIPIIDVETTLKCCHGVGL